MTAGGEPSVCRFNQKLNLKNASVEVHAAAPPLDYNFIAFLFGMYAFYSCLLFRCMTLKLR